MGYCIEMKDSTFKIHKNWVGDVTRKLRDFALSGNCDFRWVDTSIIKDEANGLYAIFDELRYPLELNGDYYEIVCFDGDRIGNDLEIFNVIAEYVEPGSYIEYVGEDSYRWRFVFDEKECREVAAKVTIEWE